MRTAVAGRGTSESSKFPPPPPPTRGRTANRGRSSAIIPQGTHRNRSASPGQRIFRTESRDSTASGGGDRIFSGTPSKDITARPAGNPRSVGSYRSEGKPSAATSRIAPERRITASPKSTQHRHDDDNRSVASNRENTDRYNVDSNSNEVSSVGKGAGLEASDKMVQQSSFWDQASNKLNELASSSISSQAACGAGAGRASYSYSSNRSTASNASQSRTAFDSARSSSRPERRDDADVDTSNMPSVSSDRPTVLYSLIKARNWDAVSQRCHHGEGKGEAGTWVVEKNGNGTVRWRLLPIHQACEMQPPEDVVKALIMAYPPAVQMKDSGGDLPLHLACRERANKDVVHTLLRADPSTAGIADDEGRLPLHLACRQGAGIDIVDDLLETYHRGAQTADSYGLLPLHWACAQNATIPIVETLLQAHPYAVEVKDKWGRTALSLAHASTNTDKTRIVSALGRDPSYWLTSLKTEVQDLRGKLETTSQLAERESTKVSGLEAKLAEVMAASSEAAQTFETLRVEMENENARLRAEVGDLGPRIKESEERNQYLEQNNATLTNRVGMLAGKLGQLTDVFREMEDHRLQVLRVTGEWESTLSKAAELVLLDDDEEQEGGI